jgi:pimeloyl-ACP methyl ester carboxylesterase
MTKNAAVAIRGDEIAFLDTGSAGPTVLLIHGNSASKEAWRRQYDSGLGNRYRMIAFDLPGHGASADAADPEGTYTMPGYAEVATALLNELGVDRAAVIGWSLGGHIAIEMIGRYSGLAGFLITGTPPVSNESPDHVAAGFHASETTALFGKEELSDDEIPKFAQAAMGYEVPLDAAAVAAVKRTDGRTRALMFAAFLAGKGVNQKKVVEETRIPTAVVNGAADPLVRGDFYEAVRFGNPWENKVHAIEGAGHAPFWAAPDAFNDYLTRFLADVLD